MSFTILKDNLIFLDSWGPSFTSELDFKCNIAEELGESSRDFIGFYMRFGEDGLDMGIKTPESAEKSIYPRDDEDLIKLATLPYPEFYGTGFVKRKTSVQDKIKKLKQFDWTKDEPTASWYIDTGDETIHYEHKYIYMNFI